MKHQFDFEWAFSEETGQVTGPQGVVIAFIAGGRSPEHVQNGNFIAASPKLLSALKHAQEIFLSDPFLGNCVDYNDVRSQIEYAIREAESR